MRLLRFVSVAAFGLVFVGVSSPAHAAGGGDHENVSTSHGDDAVVTARQSEPPAIGPPRDPNSRRDPSMFASGLALTVVGGLSAISGVFLLDVGATKSICISLDGPPQCPQRDEGQRLVNAGAAMVIAGAVTLAIGIPLLVVGGRRVGGARPRSPTATLVPIVGPGHAGSALAITF